jgi:CheY-like chemotaxis protein
MAPPLTKILYVEDDADIRTIAKLSLEAVGGFTVQVANSGAEALDIAPAFMPDLILLDVMMPGMDGPTTMQALRKLPEFEQTPIVFMTAKVMQSEIARYKEIGALDVIHKPFDPMTLSDRVKDIWRGHHG